MSPLFEKLKPLLGVHRLTERERERRKNQSEEAPRGGVGAALPVEGISTDTLEGIDAIAVHLGKPRRRVV
jgi:hypothetical protein